MKQIFIAIPSYSGYIPMRVMARLSNLIVPEGYQINLAYVEGLLIQEARHGLASQFLQKGGDYLLFIDSDQIPSQNVIKEFIELDKDIVSCPIPSRRGAKFIAVFDKNMKRLDKWSGTKECGAVGMATTMIKRKVIEKLLNKYKNPFEINLEHKEDGTWIKYSEDIMFCRTARKEGFEVWCTDEVMSAHMGEPVTYWYHKGYKNSFNHKI